MKINKAGIDLIKKFEGLYLKAYQDIVGVWTIGYGHIKDVHPGMTITEQQAEDLLNNDIAKFEIDVTNLIDVDVTENQFSSLVSFAYNLGIHNLATSTLLRKLNDGDFEGAAEEFPRWSRAGGKEIDGLKKRRLAEQELFKSSIS